MASGRAASPLHRETRPAEKPCVQKPRRHQIEIVATIGSIVLLLLLAQLGASLTAWPGTIGFLSVVLLLTQPYALVGLLEHFRPVPRRVVWAVIGGAGVGLLALVVLPYPRPPAFVITAAVYFAVVQGYAAWAFFTESRSRLGITRWRLSLACAGASAAIVLVLAEGVMWIVGARPAMLTQVMLAVGVVACYWLGLAPPRRLLTWLQQRELVRLLRQTAERAPAEREDHLADDLNSAASRGVTAGATAVLLGRDELTVYASSEPAWEGVSLQPAVGLVGIALGGVEPVVGPADECERPLNTLFAAAVVAVVPIARSTPGWGAIVVVQRRESVLLPEDLAFAGALCRHAADVLDHARLLHEERRRQLHPVPETLMGRFPAAT